MGAGPLLCRNPGRPERGREALRLLFGDERLRLVPGKAKRTYAVLGEARLDWLVAGGCFVRVPTRLSGARIPIPWAA